MAELTHPYPMYGICKKDNVPTSGLEVKIENVTRSFDHTTYTLSDGTYVDTLTNWGDVYDGDTVKVTVVTWGVSLQKSAAEGDPGCKYDFDRYTKNLVSNLGLSESDVWALNKFISEALGLADTRTRVLTFKRLKTETLGLADSYSLDIVKVLAEQIGLDDVYSRVWTITRVKTETLGLADVFIKVWDIYRVKTEQLGLKDSVIRQILFQLYKKTLTETLGLSDAQSSLVAKNLVEQLGLEDVFSRTQTLHITKTEPLGLTDSLDSILGLYRVFTEELGLQDSYIRKKLTGLLKRTFTEQLEVDDVAFRSGVSKILLESLGVKDVRSRVWILARTYTETLGLADSFGSSLYGPFYGKLTLLELTNDLDYKRLIAILELKEEA